MAEEKPKIVWRTPPAPPEHLKNCRDCGSPTEPRFHVGAQVDQWFCSNPDCWLSK